MLSRLVFWMHEKEASSCLVIRSFRSCDPLKTPALTCSKMDTFPTTRAVGKWRDGNEGKALWGEEGLGGSGGKASTTDDSSSHALMEDRSQPTSLVYQHSLFLHKLPCQTILQMGFNRGWAIYLTSGIQHSAHTHTTLTRCNTLSTIQQCDRGQQ
jgi:hypothetical protein